MWRRREQPAAAPYHRPLPGGLKTPRRTPFLPRRSRARCEPTAASGVSERGRVDGPLCPRVRGVEIPRDGVPPRRQCGWADVGGAHRHPDRHTGDRSTCFGCGRWLSSRWRCSAQRCPTPTLPSASQPYHRLLIAFEADESGAAGPERLARMLTDCRDLSGTRRRSRAPKARAWCDVPRRFS